MKQKMFRKNKALSEFSFESNQVSSDDSFELEMQTTFDKVLNVSSFFTLRRS